VDLDEPVQGLQELLMADFLERLYKKQNKAAEMSVRVY
jgi:ABC-type molybdenum transport system ATPase subunit/photorepair protein PhrA